MYLSRCKFELCAFHLLIDPSKIGNSLQHELFVANGFTALSSQTKQNEKQDSSSLLES